MKKAKGREVWKARMESKKDGYENVVFVYYVFAKEVKQLGAARLVSCSASAASS